MTELAVESVCLLVMQEIFCRGLELFKGGLGRCLAAVEDGLEHAQIGMWVGGSHHKGRSSHGMGAWGKFPSYAK